MTTWQLSVTNGVSYRLHILHIHQQDRQLLRADQVFERRNEQDSNQTQLIDTILLPQGPDRMLC